MTEKPINLKHKALDFLSRREYSYLELFNKLRKYSTDETAIKNLLDELQAKKYLSDERYIESFINSKSKKYGSRKIKYLLNSKVKDSALIEQIYASNNTDELAQAKQIWQRKFAGLPAQDHKEKARQIRFMLNRGFSMDIIQKIINVTCEEDEI